MILFLFTIILVSCDENNISGRVFFLGVIERSMIKRLLEAADIFVLMAEFNNCTNTMWEAMASGRCIVTTSNEFIREALEPDRDVVLVSWEEIGRLSGVLSDLLDNKELMAEFGRNAKIRARNILEPWQKRDYHRKHYYIT